MESFSVELHPSELMLIEAIRSINSGEVESIKIQNGLPVIFKISLGKGELCNKDVLHHKKKLK